MNKPGGTSSGGPVIAQVVEEVRTRPHSPYQGGTYTRWLTWEGEDDLMPVLIEEDLLNDGTIDSSEEIEQTALTLHEDC